MFKKIVQMSLLFNQQTKYYFDIFMKYFIALFLIVLSHWSFVKIYNIYCVPDGIFGIFILPFTASTPFCQYVNKIQLSISEYIAAFWFCLFSFISLQVTGYFNKHYNFDQQVPKEN